MVAVTSARPIGPAQQQNVRSVLYVGSGIDEISNMVARHIGKMELHYKSDVENALIISRQRHFDVVIVDQRDGELANQLLVPLLANLRDPIKLVVISPLADVGQYLRVPGVARVLTAPLREKQILRVLGLNQPKAKALALPSPAAAEKAQSDKKQPGLLSAMMMSTVSHLYKKTAFALLGILFFAFCFYGVLIGYFLVSSNWAAPVTLSRGHELVTKIESELGSLRVNLNLVDQRLSEAELESKNASRAHEDAKILVDYAGDTIEKEISAQKRNLKVLKSNVARLKKVMNASLKQLQSGGMADELAALYKKRLINRSVLNSGTLGLIDAQQKIAGLEGQVAELENEIEQSTVSTTMLQSLRKQMMAGQMSTITAASSDLLALTKQAVDARSAYDQTKSQVSSANKRLTILASSRQLLERQIADLSTSPIGRAINEKVNVLFVPYGNEQGFVAGAALYSCHLTVFWCSKAGTVGEAMAGESNTVHPFFGKPIRGFFVEALLTDQAAATREIMHAQRPPFFF